MPLTASPPPDFATAPPVRGEPTWYVVSRYPRQGGWTADEFFEAFPQAGYEFVDGVVEKLGVATVEHQEISGYLYRAMFEVNARQRTPGKVLFMGYRSYTVEEKYREPDILYLAPGREYTNRNAEGMDIAVEVVSDAASDRKRDLVTKRAEYAAAGVPEYWVVDPAERQVLVLSLRDGEYVEAVGREGDVLESIVLPGFEVDVTECLSAGG